MEYVERKIIEKLLPPLPQGASEQKLQDYENSFNKMRQKLRDGKLDHLLIEIEVSTPPIDISNSGNIPPEMANVQESI